MTSTLEQNLQTLQHSLSDALANSSSKEQLELVRQEFFGKKSNLSSLSQQLGSLDADARKAQGAIIHAARTAMQNAFDARKASLDDALLAQLLAAEQVDISLGGNGQLVGSLHPVTQVMDRINGFFTRAGFTISSGPEVETDYYNFEALNIPSHHPARAMHDTFYFDVNHLLRTHTSSVQILTMQTQQPHIRIISPGRV